MFNKTGYLIYLLIVFKFVNSFNFINADSDQQDYIPHSDNVELHVLCMRQINTMESVIVETMHELFTYKQYWLKQQLVPNHSLLPMPIFKWLYGKTLDDVIHQALTTLEYQINQNAHRLGTLVLQKNMIKREDTSFHQHIEDVTWFICNILHNAAHNTKVSVISPSLLQSVIINNIAQAKLYKTNNLRSVQLITKPGHFRRNWGKYTIIGILTTIGLGYWVTHPVESEQTKHDLQNALQDFWTSRIYTPLQNAWDILFLKKDRVLLPVETHATEIDLYKKEIRNYLEDRNDRIRSWQRTADSKKGNSIIDSIKNPFNWIGNNNNNNDVELTIPEIETIITDAAEKRQLPHIIRNDLAEQEKHPLKNTVGGEFSRLKLIEIRQKTIIGADMILMLSNLLKSYDLYIELMAILPSCALLYAVYNFSSKAYVSAIRKSMISAMRNIEIILTDSDASDALDSIGEGLLYYWIANLKKYGAYIPTSQQLFLQQDLEQLAQINYSKEQKKEIINRMYHTYDILTHI